MDLAQGKIGDVGDFELDLVEGNVVARVGVKKDLVEGAISVSNDTKVVMTPKIFLDKLKKLIPGGVDDAIIDMLADKFLKKPE